MAWIRDRALTLVLMAMFLLFLAGQLLTGLAEYNSEQLQHEHTGVSMSEYLGTGHPWEALFENWESEFLQMAVFVLLTTFLIQKGAPESRRPAVKELVEADPRDFADDPDAPWPVRRGGWIRGAASAEQGAVSAGFDYSIVDHTAHRPWPMPRRPWLMTQSWHDLLFAHWRVDVSELRRAVPAAFDLDLFDDEAWLGIVPFHMTNVGLRATPTVPWVSAFPELNVRTYVRVADRPGVYFFSLDAARGLAVAAARALLNLPYYTADMTLEWQQGNRLKYETVRRTREHAQFKATYEPVGVPFAPSVGSIEDFLTERYCLYHHNRQGHPYRLEIHHRPWSLQSARATITMNTMAAASQLTLNGAPALLHFARRQDVVAWAPTGLSDGRHRSVRNVTE